MTATNLMGILGLIGLIGGMFWMLLQELGKSRSPARSAPRRESSTLKEVALPVTRFEGPAPDPTPVTIVDEAVEAPSCRVTPHSVSSEPVLVGNGESSGKRWRYPPCQPFPLPALPEKFDKVYQARSLGGEPGAIYELNPVTQTCSCEDFKTLRAVFPTGDVRRVCAHIAMKFQQIRAREFFDPLTWAMVSSSTFSRRDACYARLPGKAGESGVGYTPGLEVVNVLTRKRRTVDGASQDATGDYAWFSYDLAAEKWLEKDPMAEELTGEVRRYFGLG
ncbi:MAG: hypothetical protein HQL56_00590 [Magnetococcales bacterium]|nr:hypothetical protein [Magnetococcales bacterium]